MKRVIWFSPGLVVLALVIANLPPWVWHPLFGKGYQLWSGIASDVSELSLLVSVIAGAVALRRWLHHHFECHEETCTRLGFHHLAGTPFRTCWYHHPILRFHVRHAVPLHTMHKAHKEANVGSPATTR